jgi:hypothetical protein
VRRLNDQGVPSPAVNKIRYANPDRCPRWGRSQVLRILREPTYKGDAIGWRYAEGGRLRPGTEWIRLPSGTAPAIIDAGLWEAAATRLVANRGQDVWNQTRPYLLRGHIVCAVCHQTMYSEPGRGIRRYRCSSREKVGGACDGKVVRADDVETWVWSQVSAILHDPSLVAAELQRRQAEGPDPAAVAERDRLQRRLGTFEKQQQRLIHHFREDETAPWELIRRELTQIEQDKRQVEAMLVAIEQRLAEQQMTVTQLETLETYCARVSRQCERFDFEGKRLALAALNIQVTANGREWQMHGSIPVARAGVVTQISGDYDRL